MKMRDKVKNMIRRIKRVWWRILDTGVIRCNIKEERYTVVRFLGLNIYNELNSCGG